MSNRLIKLKARFVVGFEAGTHVVYEPGELVYQGDSIVYVGKQYDQIVDETRSYPDCMLIPGLIDLDADVDSDHALQDIAVSSKVFQLDRSKQLSTAYSNEDFHARHRFSFAHLLKNGITTVLPISGETFYPWGMSIKECEIMMEEAVRTGIRAYIGPSFKSRKFPDEPFDDERGYASLHEAIAFCERTFPETIVPFLNPCQIHITRLDMLKEAATYAKQHQLPFRLHACEAIREWKYTVEHYQKTTIQLFAKEGMLFDQFIIPHCITTTNEELNLLASYGVSVVSTPFADANTGTGLFSFDKYVAYGVNMTMGTDTHPGDMLRNMKMAWDLDHLCHRRKFFSTYKTDGTMVPLLPEEPLYPKTDAYHYFNAATINGAKALGREDIGRLCKGAKADIVAITMRDLLIGPLHDPIRSLINSATGAQVKDVIVNGKDIIVDYKMLNEDEETLLEKAQVAYDHYVSNYEKYDQNQTKNEELFPPSYQIK